MRSLRSGNEVSISYETKEEYVINKESENNNKELIA